MAEKVDAPIINEFPICLECELLEESYYIIGIYDLIRARNSKLLFWLEE